MKGSLLLYNLTLNCLIFSTGLNSSVIIFIQTYTVNYRNALDRLRVRMNINLFSERSATDWALTPRHSSSLWTTTATTTMTSTLRRQPLPLSASPQLLQQPLRIVICVRSASSHHALE